MKSRCAFYVWILLAATDVCSQSLSEVARKEAERRRMLERQGIQGKTITQGDPAQLAPNGNLSRPSLPAASAAPARTGAQPRKKVSAEKFRAELQKLDREIRRSEERLTSLHKRLEVERGLPVRLGRASSPTATTENQIRDIEIKLKRLREERLKTYDAGLKAGFLPGELDGKGIIP